MPALTTDDTKALEAVNEMLAGIGQAPATTLETTNPDVAIAFDTLKWISREVQSEGWTFNKEYEYPFTPNGDKEIVIPDNIIQIDLSNLYQYKHIDAVRRNGKLYNRTNHTFEWDGQICADVVWEFDFTDLPLPAFNYIVARAAVQFASRVVGDPQLIQVLASKEAYNRAFFLEYECNQGQFTFFGHPKGGNYYNSYEPYKALNR